MHLRPEQKQQLDTVGFTNVGPLFRPEEIEEIRAEYDRLVNFDAQTLGNDRDGRFPYRAMLNFRSDALRRFVHHPELMELVGDRLGPDVRFWWDQGINKAPGAGSIIPWHQDNGYHEGQVPEYLTTWLALDDSDLENGGLEVIPGSHLGGFRAHQPAGAHWEIPDVETADVVALDARAGDLLLFSTLLIHRTVGNRTTDRHRRAWVMQYAKADIRNEVTGEVYDDRAWVIRDGVPQDRLWSERRFRLGGKGDHPS